MPGRELEVHPEALAEARAAYVWYRERSQAAAAAFVDELDRSIQRIVEVPERWPVYAAGTRRFLLRRFPFFVVYRINPATIEILAVAHGRRRPGYWKERKDK